MHKDHVKIQYSFNLQLEPLFEVQINCKCPEKCKSIWWSSIYNGHQTPNRRFHYWMSQHTCADFKGKRTLKMAEICRYDSHYIPFNESNLCLIYNIKLSEINICWMNLSIKVKVCQDGSVDNCMKI